MLVAKLPEMTPAPSGSSRRGAPRLPADVRPFRVTDEQQARLLTDPRFQSTFRVFLAREATVSMASQETGSDMNAALYRVRTLAAAGLLEVVREEPRKGRPIKVYRSSHDAYFIPYQATPFASLEERLLAQMLPELRQRVAIQARRMQRDGREGQQFFRDESGETWLVGARDEGSVPSLTEPGHVVATDFVTDLSLSEEQARELQGTLIGLLRAYPQGKREAKGSSGHRQYRLVAALLPLEE